ncbi:MULTISPECIES: ATP synthase F1 subunit epsilon [unclassified Sulfurospirillum]|uniref:ATP synthase F1 subunit epsilon n=1 Tax=unclassified Sulfurospirillum TaxID=2618290 RepID=UPI0005088741|nr:MULTISPECIES: ATP synthase F1 subunit epsilon [unclassified Sulfurospirillum]KFL33294.1 ATP synthase F0F1 subunit epsilon [Sulfurospirillum sp. SCADC]
MNTLKLEIVTPSGQIFANDVKSVTLPGKEGEFGVLPNHASLVTLLQAGVIDIELQDGNHDVVAINWGHVKVDENSVTVLADGAVSIGGINESEVAKSLEAAKALLESISDSDIAIAIATAKIDSIAKTRKF